MVKGNVFVYDTLRGLARNLANKNRIENPRGFSEVDENKQLLIAIVERILPTGRKPISET